jgi:hypothetical protein
MKKPGLNQEQHKRLGAELYQMKIQLQRISIYLGANYPFYKLRKIKIDQVIEGIFFSGIIIMVTITKRRGGCSSRTILGRLSKRVRLFP